MEAPCKPLGADRSCAGDRDSLVEIQHHADGRPLPKLACRAVPIAMMDRLRRSAGAELWITRFADGTITAEASDMSTEHPSVTNQLWQEPGTCEIAVILANAEVPWDRSSVCDGGVGFWEGMLSFNKPGVQ